VADKTQDAQDDAAKAWPELMTWVGRATALLGLFATLAGGVTWLVSHHRHAAERKAKMALAQAQVQQQDYQSAVASYGEILKSDPTFRPALDAQLNAAELWIENFHVLAREDQDAATLAAAYLDQAMPVLEAGLTRSKGTEAADVQAHIGWAHWLNQKIAEREFGPAGEQNISAALAADPTNVYANAMVGNHLLQQNHPDVAEAMHHFDVALATGKARPWVRTMQLGGLIYLDLKGARAAQVRVVNDMRKAGEPLDDDDRRRVLSFCFNPTTTARDELVESLTAVPPDEEWKTYLWLDDQPDDPRDDRLVQEFIQANLLEVSGNRAQALENFRRLSQELKNSSSTMVDQVNAAIARLSHG
jgi:tetratricopeptide (TPR) repeat protein